MSGNFPHAVLTDYSTFKNEDNDNYRYYIKTSNGYFLENKIVNNFSKSLFDVLGLKEGHIVGIYFSTRVLMFALVNGTIKSRFSPEGINSPDEIVYPLEEWGLSQNTPITIYGIHAPIESLINKIKISPSFKDRELIIKKFKIIQNVIAVFIILLSFMIYLSVYMSNLTKEKEVEIHKKTINALKQELAKNFRERLPFYLECKNVPIDQIFKEISFLEKYKLSSVEISANSQNIKVKIQPFSVNDAYEIRQKAEQNNATFELNIIQGGSNVESIITKNFEFKKENFTNDINKFCSLIDHYNQYYIAKY